MSTPREQLALLLSQMQQPQEQIAYPEMQALPGPAEIPVDDARPLRRMQALGLLGSMAGGRVGQFAGNMQQTGVNTEQRMLKEALQVREALAQQVNAENQYGQQRANFETGRQDAGNVNLGRQAGILGQMATIDNQRATLANQNRDEYAATDDAAGNPILYNKRTGEVVQGGLGGAGGVGVDPNAPPTIPKLTEQGAKAFNSAAVLTRNLPKFDRLLKDEGGVGKWAQFARLGPASVITGDKQREIITLSEEILEAIMREASGAAVPDPERERRLRSLLPNARDNRKQIEDKIKNLYAVRLDNIAKSGPSAKAYYDWLEKDSGFSNPYLERRSAEGGERRNQGGEGGGERKTVGGKSYVSVNGEWYEE